MFEAEHERMGSTQTDDEHGQPRRFRLGREVREGRFGAVRRAVLAEGGRARRVDVERVADVSDGAVAGLRTAVKVAEAADHPVIVRPLALLQLDDHWALVTEVAAGLPLSRLPRPIPAGAALEIVAGIAAAGHAWAEAEDRIAPLRPREIRLEDVHVTREGQVRVALLARVDVQWLGRLLHELLTGEPLVEPAGDADRSRGQRRRAADAVWEVVPDLELTDFLEQMLATPSERPRLRDVERTCRELRDDLALGSLAEWASEAVPEEAGDGELGPEHVEVLPEDAQTSRRSPWDAGPNDLVEEAVTARPPLDPRIARRLPQGRDWRVFVAVSLVLLAMLVALGLWMARGVDASDMDPLPTGTIEATPVKE